MKPAANLKYCLKTLEEKDPEKFATMKAEARRIIEEVRKLIPVEGELDDPSIHVGPENGVQEDDVFTIPRYNDKELGFWQEREVVMTMKSDVRLINFILLVISCVPYAYVFSNIKVEGGTKRSKITATFRHVYNGIYMKSNVAKEAKNLWCTLLDSVVASHKEGSVLDKNQKIMVKSLASLNLKGLWPQKVWPCVGKTRTFGREFNGIRFDAMEGLFYAELKNNV